MARRGRGKNLKRYPKASAHCRAGLSAAMKKAHGNKGKMRAAMLAFRKCAGWS